jgi:tol-pal system protein YbgF
MRSRILVTLTAFAAFTAGVSAQNRQDLQVNADLRMLQEQVQKLQLTVNVLTERGKTTEGRLEAVANANQKSFADQKLATDQISNTLSTLGEKAVENNTRVLQLTQEVQALREGLRMVTTQLNTLVSVLQPAVNPVDPNAPAGGGPLGQVNLVPSPMTMMKAAEGDFMSGKFDLAISGYKEVLEKFPTSPQAADAQYWIAESLFSQGKCREALPEYDRLTKNFKESRWLPDAYLMQGVCYDELKQPANATKMYNIVIKQYPQSDAATGAQQRLAQRR